MAASDLQSVVHFALLSRILAIFFQMVFNSLIPDHRADAFRVPQLNSPSTGDVLLEFLFGGFSRWDAQHFLFIAEFGYIYEQNFAFLPLFPASIWAVAEILLGPLELWLSFHSRLLLASMLLNTVIFVLSAVILYQLGVAVLHDHRLALMSSLLFCLNPASVFMSAAYSESIFMLLTLSGMLHHEKARPLTSCVLFALSTAARSNGIVNAGFLFHSQLKYCILYLRPKLKFTGKDWHKLFLSLVLRSALLVTAGSVVIVLPFALFQYYGYLTFCRSAVNPVLTIPQHLLQLAREKGYLVPDKDSVVPSWCHHRYPIVYSYVQDTYWNVGFMRYYQLRQLPNFLLAFPMIALGVWAAWEYVLADPWYCIHLGLVHRKLKGEKERDGKPLSGFHSHRVFVYVVHATALLAFGVCFMHIQVITRFLASASPILYWFSAYLLQETEPRHLAQDSATSSQTYKFTIIPRNHLTALLQDWRRCSLTARCVLGYFLLYWFLGLALHCNFLPWT
ncbi:palmitoyltransferase ZDHHC18-A [Pristis pectinata]|uniref:palmitoyltransferase ZDHHC18-A n=1 Tax=Pristis pectinata TaxID=685728 RepID=UPI00223DE5CC|nr:palmitoyltransferase ZDHHC18-A [Pristis pectinata]XP_051892095.1 palmitoyltransferase ZDHHC18-A [Pristis pectinata]XP_051892096.1 palmitoyltransferase ZDHHC18-A [Pristis pectinata]